MRKKVVILCILRLVFLVPPISLEATGLASWRKQIARRNLTFLRADGAVNQIRTGDLFLTKEVLCLLSYNSTLRKTSANMYNYKRWNYSQNENIPPIPVIPRKMATRNGLEPSTSSVTG